MVSPLRTCGFTPEFAATLVSYAEFMSGVVWFIYACFTLVRYLETGEELWIYTAVAVPLRILAHLILGVVLYKGITKRNGILLKSWLWARGILLVVAVLLMIITLSAFSAPHQILWPVIVWDMIYWVLILYWMSVVLAFLGQLEVKITPKTSSNNADTFASVPHSHSDSHSQPQTQLNLTGISNPNFEVQELDGGFGLSIGHI